MSSSPPIKVADASVRTQVLNTIFLGFAGDPMARWSYPEPTNYIEAMPRFIEAFGGRAFDHGSAYYSEGFGAAALWLPPGIGPDEEAMGQVLEETVSPEIAQDIGGMLEEMGGYHPHEPHWYLPLIAADQQWIGKGLGTLLMRHALQRCDDEGIPAYLESSNPKNIPFYERFGFRVLGEIQRGSSPVMTPMLRPAS